MYDQIINEHTYQTVKDIFKGLLFVYIMFKTGGCRVKCSLIFSLSLLSGAEDGSGAFLCFLQQRRHSHPSLQNRTETQKHSGLLRIFRLNQM